jgi:hypothetical protein
VTVADAPGVSHGSLDLAANGALTDNATDLAITAGANSVITLDPDVAAAVYGSPGAVDGAAGATVALENTDQYVFFSPTSQISTEVEDYTNLTSAGTLTSDDFDLTNGTQQLQLFSGLPSGDSSQVINYASWSDSGSAGVLNYSTNFTNNTSQLVEYSPTSEISQEVFNWSSINDTGSVTSAILDMLNGDVEDIIAQIVNGTSGYVDSLYSGAGALLSQSDYSSFGAAISGEGGYAAPNPDDPIDDGGDAPGDGGPAGTTGLSAAAFMAGVAGKMTLVSRYDLSPGSAVAATQTKAGAPADHSDQSASPQSLIAFTQAMAAFTSSSSIVALPVVAPPPPPMLSMLASATH